MAPGAWTFIAAVVIGFIVAWGILTRNRLTRYVAHADASWRNIEAQLKRRWDIIPLLIDVAKGYAANETAIFERVARARVLSMDAQDPREQAEAQQRLQDALFALYAMTEGYPELQASENFGALQASLSETEDEIQESRRMYNAMVREINAAVFTFPRRIIASIFHFKPRDFYILSHEEEDVMPRMGY